MSTRDRKINFYVIALSNIDLPDQPCNQSEIVNLFNYIIRFVWQERKMDINRENKVHALDSFSSNDNATYHVVMKTAKYRHRPPLLDTINGTERDNPKRIHEGEPEKTHLAFKVLADEIILIMEDKKNGIAIGRFIDYLNKFRKRYFDENNNDIAKYAIDWSILPKDDFLYELRSLSSVKIGEVYYDKQCMGSEFLNWSERTENVQRDIVISMRAIRGESIFDTIMDVYDKFNVTDSVIKKIRISGKNINNNNVILDTDLIKKTEHVTVDIEEETGVVNTAEMFRQFNEILLEM